MYLYLLSVLKVVVLESRVLNVSVSVLRTCARRRDLEALPGSRAVPDALVKYQPQGLLPTSEFI